MLTTGAPGNDAERTWRPPVTTLVATAVCLGLLTALPGLLLALTLATSQVPDGGWIALALAGAVWGLLAWRVLAQSVTLTPDTLVIRNVLATEQVRLADVAQVGFRRGRLTVTCAHGAAASTRLAVSAARLGPSRWSGVRSNADAIAEAITKAAGLPPLPPRREVISRHRAWIILLAGALCFGLGVYGGPMQSGRTGLPFALRLVGAVLYAIGAAMLGLALRIIRDHRRNLTADTAPHEQD